MQNSKLLKLDSLDWGKIGKGALIAIIGALLTYLTDLLPNIEFGVWTPAVMAIWSVVVNIIRKLLTNSKKEFLSVEK